MDQRKPGSEAVISVIIQLNGIEIQLFFTYFTLNDFFPFFMVSVVVFLLMFTQRNLSFGTTQFSLRTFRRRNLCLAAMGDQIWHFCCTRRSTTIPIRFTDMLVRFTAIHHR